MSRNDGKNFERRISRWLDKTGFHNLRIFDSASIGRVSSKRPADFMVYNDEIFYVECKSTTNTNVSHESIVRQARRLIRLRRNFGIRSFFLFDFIEEDGVVAVPTYELVVHVKESEKKSVNFDDVCKIGLVLHGWEDFKGLFT